MIYKLNAITFTILSVQSGLLLFAVYYTKFRAILGCCHCCCTLFLYLGSAVSAIVFRYVESGASCSLNTDYYNTEGNTFDKDAAELSSLSIYSTILWFVFFCATCCVVLAPPTKKKPVGGLNSENVVDDVIIE